MYLKINRGLKWSKAKKKISEAGGGGGESRKLLDFVLMLLIHPLGFYYPVTHLPITCQ